MNPNEPAGQVTEEVKQTVREASPWLVLLGRFGYAMKGAVYILIGILAAHSAISWGAENEGPTGAMGQVTALPFGRYLLVAVAVGLASHALWRLIQAFMDTENKGSAAKGLAARGSYAMIALIYLGLAYYAVKIALGAGGGEGGGGERSTQSWTASLLGQPFGQWLVALAGVIVIGVGLFQFYQLYSAKFLDKFLLGEMSEADEKWVRRLGRLGLAARGVTFSIMGVFLLFAAYHADPAESHDLGGTLNVVEGQYFGAWLLGLLAVGLIAYGLFMFVLAKHRRMVIT